MERTKVNSVVNNTAKAPKNQGFLEKCFQSGHSFSSQARYDHFDTSPQYNYSVFGTDNMISSAARYDHFNTLLHSNLHIFYPLIVKMSRGVFP